MPRRTALFPAVAGIVVGVFSTFADVPPTSATGGDPVMVLGVPAGVNVPANAGTTSPDAYKGFNVHVSAVTTAGVTLTAISGSPTGGTLDTGGLFCTTQVPAANEVNYGCVALDGQSTTAAGLLATMTLQATGDGCIRLRLIDLPPTDPNAAVSDTYTIDQATNNSQQNAVSAGYVDVLAGAGSPASCPPPPASVDGVAQVPDSSQLIDRADGPRLPATTLALAAVFVAVGTGWVARRRRAR